MASPFSKLSPLCQSNPWMGFLEEYPETAYYGAIPSGSQGFYDYWLKNIGKVAAPFQALEAQEMMKGGLAGTLSWPAYLAQYPFRTEWLKTAPWDRGALSTGALRWNVPW